MLRLPRRPKLAVRRESTYRPRVESMEARRLLAIITVTSAGDAVDATDGVVTLREAITAANSNKNVSDVVGVGVYGNDTIDFDIPGSGVHTIQPTSALPEITDPLTIDGYSQPGSAPNTNPVGQGLNGTLLIEISGENAGDVRFGLIQLDTHDSVVRGLVINRAQGIKLSLGNNLATDGDNQVEGCYIGPDASGTAAFAASPNPNLNDREGIFVSSVGNTIGGTTPADRNLISGNVDRGSSIASAYGISFRSGIATTVNNFVEGNLIGTDRTGMKALGNDSGGVAGGASDPAFGVVVVGGLAAGAGNLISGNGGIGVSSRNGVVEGNFIGTDVTGTLPIGNAVGVEATGNVEIERNVIAFNTSAGVNLPGLDNQFGALVPTTGNLITQNSIFSNFGPGIGGSSYLNDAPDADGIQNYPTLASVMPNGAGTRVVGTLSSKPSSNYRLEFFASTERVEDAHDVGAVTMPGAFAQGRTYLGAINVTTDATGLASFTADLPALPAGQPYVTATATDITDDGSGPRNNTSPFSAAAVLGGPSFVVTNTNDSGLGSLREAIFNANLTPGAQTITFAIPATDPRHFYYRNDGVAGGVTTADIATTTATDDSKIADIDPDWPHSWYSIAPTHDLPQIFDTVVIDGYSQPGSRQNTLPALGPLDTVLRIELDGANASGIGLELHFFNDSIDPGKSRIDGLAINQFGGDGINVSTLAGGVVIAGDFIGTDVSGTNDLGNLGSGVYLNVEVGDAIGGQSSADFNLISGNETNGVESRDSISGTITGNLFGLDRNLAFSLPNTGPSIVFSLDPRAGEAAASNSTAAFSSPASMATTARRSNGVLLNEVGSEGPSHGADAELDLRPNIGDSLGAAVSVGILDSYNLPRNQNVKAVESIATEAFLGIDLGDDGVTPNDLGDGDTGPNGLQNYPVLTSASTTTATTVTGTLNSLPSTSFRIELYSQTVGPDFRAGERSLGTLDVTTDAQGNASFTFSSPVSVPVGQFITALATRLAAGTLTPIETSEFSAAIAVTGASAPATANLSVTQSATPNPVAAGGDLTFTLTVANAGPSPATGVRLLVSPPAGAIFVAATGGLAPVSGALTFNLGTLANGASTTVTVIVQPPAPGAYVTTAAVNGDELDPVAGDNVSSLAVAAVDRTGPTIVSIARVGKAAKPTGLILTFSEPLALAGAANLAAYRLVTAGRDKKFGTRDDVRVKLKSAVYDPATRRVTIITKNKAILPTKFRLVVDGSTGTGPADLAGNLLDANDAGQPSGDFIRDLTRRSLAGATPIVTVARMALKRSPTNTARKW